MPSKNDQCRGRLRPPPWDALVTGEARPLPRGTPQSERGGLVFSLWDSWPLQLPGPLVFHAASGSAWSEEGI